MTSHRIADVVLGLALRLDALDAEPAEVLAHPGERALVQEAGEVVGAVGQELAPRDADEEIEELPRDRLRARRGGSLRERDMGEAERARVALEVGEAGQHVAGRGAPEHAAPGGRIRASAGGRPRPPRARAPSGASG